MRKNEEAAAADRRKVCLLEFSNRIAVSFDLLQREEAEVREARLQEEVRCLD